MPSEIKKYLSFILLFFFLFPMVEKEFHAFEHSTDEHCIANEKHFHDLEHHCDICDLTITDSNTPANTDYPIINSVHQFFELFNESTHINTAFQHLPSRAPPLA